MAELRGHKDVFEYLLFDQKVTREMYDRQIDVITERLAPHMRRYARLLQKVHKLDRMTFADLKVPVDPEYDPRVSIAESHRYVREGLSVLGKDYVEMIDRAYRERWIDFAKNVVSFRVHIYSLQNILSRTVTPIIYGFMRVGPVYLEFGLVFNPVCPADHIMEID